VDSNSYFAFLAIGVLLTVIDGQIIYRSGIRYLGNSHGEQSSMSMARLISVLFHLIVLGVLALLSTIDIGGTSTQAVVGRLGVFLLLLAVAHAITLAVFSRMRENRMEEDILTRHGDSDGMTYSRDYPRDPVVNPVPGQPGRDPEVSPSLDHGRPYRAD
jgi:hypothetical protein